MKLVRFGPKGRERPGVVDAAGVIRDISTLTPDIVTGPVSSWGVASTCATRDPSCTCENWGLLDVPGTFDFTSDAGELPFYPDYGADNL